MPPLPIFILGAVILAWVLAAMSLLARRRWRYGAASFAARAGLSQLTEDDVARRIGAGWPRSAAIAGPGAITTRSAAAPGSGSGDVDREPPAARRYRLWRDAATVLLVSSLAALAVTTFEPNLLPSRAGTGTNLLVAVATSSAGPAPDTSPNPSSATTAGATPEPTLVLTSGATAGPAPTPAGAASGSGLAARDDAFTVLAVGPARLDVLANDGGGAGGPLTVTAVTQGARGTVTTDGTSVTYHPAGCPLGTDTFGYTVTDGRSSVSRSVRVTMSRPGRNGFPSTPLTDAPRLGFVPGSMVGSTVPMRLSWCGVAATTLGGYTVAGSVDGGRSWSSPIYPMTTLTGSVRTLALDVDYAWRVRTVDAAGRASAYAVSLPSRISRIEDTETRLVQYAGPWQTAGSAGYSGGTERYASSPAATATLVVTGARAFAIVSSEVGTRGSFRVLVDGAQVAIVSERTPSVLLRRVVYVGNLAPATSHTIVIRPFGDGRVDLDAILTLQ